jgi:hypothetical protein
MEWEVRKPRKPIRATPDSKDKLFDFRDKRPQKTPEELESEELLKLLEEN